MVVGKEHDIHVVVVPHIIMSLTSAWIHMYLISVAEEHGQDLKLSLQTRNRKVQLTEVESPTPA